MVAPAVLEHSWLEPTADGLMVQQLLVGSLLVVQVDWPLVQATGCVVECCTMQWQWIL
jgi:hypothetical protein